MRLADEWVPVEGIEMDFLIVVDPDKKQARCVPLGKIRKGDPVVVGEEGVLVSYPDRPRTSSTFEFMHGTVSSERPSETLIAQIAKELPRSPQERREDHPCGRSRNYPHRG